MGEWYTARLKPRPFKTEVKGRKTRAGYPSAEALG